ncbi:hypothetical protein ERJ75_001296300 [Trypanosoma vivax]|nr:hypothetical protein ERJ75_001296300 [Trypanosoma vivax]
MCQPAFTEGRFFQRVAEHLAGASGPLVVGAGVSSHHVLWDPFRRVTTRESASSTGACRRPVDCQCRIGHQATAGHGSTVVTGNDVVQRLRGLRLEVRTESTQRSLLDHVRCVRGTSLDAIAPSKHARAPHAWNKTRWHEFRKLNDEFILRGMKRPAKAADAPSDAVTRGIRMAAKRTFPKGKGMAPPFWTPELTKLDVAVQECKNERKRDALIRWRRKVLADTR